MYGLYLKLFVSLFAETINKLRTVFHRARGGSLFLTIGELNAILRGWRQYFRLENRKDVFEALDIHIRRHLRKLMWIAWRRPRTRERELRRRGLDGFRAWKSANNGRGAWWNAGALHMRDAFPKSFFRRQGLLQPSRDALSPLLFLTQKPPDAERHVRTLSTD